MCNENTRRKRERNRTNTWNNNDQEFSQINVILNNKSQKLRETKQNKWQKKNHTSAYYTQTVENQDKEKILKGTRGNKNTLPTEKQR